MEICSQHTAKRWHVKTIGEGKTVIGKNIQHFLGDLLHSIGHLPVGQQTHIAATLALFSFSRAMYVLLIAFGACYFFNNILCIYISNTTLPPWLHQIAKLAWWTSKGHSVNDDSAHKTSSRQPMSFSCSEVSKHSRVSPRRCKRRGATLMHFLVGHVETLFWGGGSFVEPSLDEKRDWHTSIWKASHPPSPIPSIG